MCASDPIPPPPLAPLTLIAFTGLAGSGKTTAAMHLVKAHGFTRLRFAGPLKAMLAALGLTPAQIDGDEKEVPCELLCGRTPRWAMQSLGTEWGRELIGSDLWMRAWRVALAKCTSNVVADDCRFPNEADAIRAAGGVIVRIERPGVNNAAATHVSEQHVIEPDFTIRNEGSMMEFLSLIEGAGLGIGRYPMTRGERINL